ncbi:D-alanyl-D-alanine carboxypeptidase [Candidatus Parcubacteria bacterium]|nr:MAG: D-alanyl-D-alanine carboxypeptidase [Candidatus Parcubacteria bacterium]
MKDYPSSKKNNKEKKSKKSFTGKELRYLISIILEIASGFSLAMTNFRLSLVSLRREFCIALKNLFKPQLKKGIVLLFLINLLLVILLFYYLNKIEENKVNNLSIKDVRINSLPFLSSTPKFDITARSYIVYEKDSRTIVFSKNENLRFAPASTVKIMTALVSLEYYDLDEYLSTQNVNMVKGSKMGIVEGDLIKVQNLLYGLLLPSGNDAAYVLASNYPGGINTFITKMNKKAKDLKLINTYFVDTSGYEDANYTTAFDLARLASYALENKMFQIIVKTKSIGIYGQNKANYYNLQNLNKLLDIEGIEGVKTGFTEEAGGVLVTAFVYKGKSYILTVLKSEDRFYDTQNLINKVIKNIELIKY